MQNKDKFMRIKPDVHEQLRLYGEKGETYNQIIKKILRKVKQ